MTFADGVVYLDQEDTRQLAAILVDAVRRPGSTARFAIDEGGVKVSIGRGTWTPAIGTTDPDR